MSVSDRYFFYTAFLFSLFGCLSVSKAVRDKQAAQYRVVASYQIPPPV